MDYCGTDELKYAIAQLKLCGVSVCEETQPAVFFHFCQFKTEDSKGPLRLTTLSAIDVFGDSFEKAIDGLVGFPTFQGVEEDVGTLFEAIRSKKKLVDLRIGKDLIRLAQKFPESFTDSDGRKTKLLAYLDIIMNKKRMTRRRENLMKLVNGKVISWLDYDNKEQQCHCNKKPALYQNSTTCQLFYGCAEKLKNKENVCHYGKDLWMSLL